MGNDFTSWRPGATGNIGLGRFSNGQLSPHQPTTKSGCNRDKFYQPTTKQKDLLRKRAAAKRKKLKLVSAGNDGDAADDEEDDDDLEEDSSLAGAG